jgi:SAM-dependent methyltransferase
VSGTRELHTFARALETVADEYERGRPDYPDDAVAWLAEQLDLRPGRRVLDLAAGGGKLTRKLLAFGPDVVAVEPGDGFRGQLEETLPQVDVLDGVAEDIPLGEASVDAVTVAQSFHWFRADEALRETRRVLRPGGRLAVMWNRRDMDDPVQAEFNRLIAPLREGFSWNAPRWTSALQESALFDVVAERSVRFDHVLDADGVLVHGASIGFVAAADADARAALERELREFAAARGPRLPFGYWNETLVLQRVDGEGAR